MKTLNRNEPAEFSRLRGQQAVILILIYAITVISHHLLVEVATKFMHALPLTADAALLTIGVMLIYSALTLAVLYVSHHFANTVLDNINKLAVV